MLKLRKKPKSGFVLAPTPYLPYPDFSTETDIKTYSRPFDKESVYKFFAWLSRHTENKPMAKYELAELLDVHRIVIEEWVMALDHLYLLNRETVMTNRGTIELLYTKAHHNYILDKYDERPKPCSDYDPWTNRKWDANFCNCWQPYFIDEVVHKYYSVFEDEVYIHTGVRRDIEDNLRFVPLLNERHSDDHPLAFKGKDKKAAYSKKTGRPNPPPLERRIEIESKVACEKRIRRRGERTEQQSFVSWRLSQNSGDASMRLECGKDEGANGEKHIRVRKRPSKTKA